MRSDEEQERLAAFLLGRFAELLAASAVRDALPGSGYTVNSAGTIVVSVTSASGGQVTIGAIHAEEIAAGAVAMTPADIERYRTHVRDLKAGSWDGIRDLAETLQRKRDAPNVARSRKSADRKKEALDLHGKGRSQNYISKALGISRKTVKRYLDAD